MQLSWMFSKHWQIAKIWYVINNQTYAYRSNWHLILNKLIANTTTRTSKKLLTTDTKTTNIPFAIETQYCSDGLSESGQKQFWMFPRDMEHSGVSNLRFLWKLVITDPNKQRNMKWWHNCTLLFRWEMRMYNNLVSRLKVKDDQVNNTQSHRSFRTYSCHRNTLNTFYWICL